MSGTASRSEVGVDRGLEEWIVLFIVGVAVGWLVWVTWLVGMMSDSVRIGRVYVVG